MEWVYPFAFFVWLPARLWSGTRRRCLLDFIPPDSQSLMDQMSQLHLRKDVTPEWPGPFGGFTDFIDWFALIMIPIITFSAPAMCVARRWNTRTGHPVDRAAIFVGRVTMMMIISMTLIMLYEVFLRYVVEAADPLGERVDSLDCRLRVPHLRLLCDAATLPHPDFHPLRNRSALDAEGIRHDLGPCCCHLRLLP